MNNKVKGYGTGPIDLQFPLLIKLGEQKQSLEVTLSSGLVRFDLVSLSLLLFGQSVPNGHFCTSWSICRR